MSEPTIDTSNDADNADPAAEGGEQPVDWEAEATKWRELSRRNEAAKKAAQDDLATLQQANLRRDAALEAGVPLDLADRLTGTTAAELLEDARHVAELMKASSGPGRPPLPGAGAHLDVPVGAGAVDDPLGAVLRDSRSR